MVSLEYQMFFEWLAKNRERSISQCSISSHQVLTLQLKCSISVKVPTKNFPAVFSEHTVLYFFVPQHSRKQSKTVSWFGDSMCAMCDLGWYILIKTRGSSDVLRMAKSPSFLRRFHIDPVIKGEISVKLYALLRVNFSGFSQKDQRFCN